MEATVIGSRYAKALIKLIGEDHKLLEATGDEVEALAGLYQESPQMQELILEPKYSKSVKAKAIGEIMSQFEFSELVQKFARYLTSQGRFEIIGAVALSFEQLSNALLGKAKATITVAKDLSDKEVADLQKKLSAYSQKKVELSVTVDPAIIGGAITQIGSLVLDGSIKNRLNQIKETISKGN